MTPPTHPPPHQQSPVLSYEAYEPPSARTEGVGMSSNGHFANKVWTAPGLTASPRKVREPRPAALHAEGPGTYSEGFVVEAGEVVSSSCGRGVVGSQAPRPENFEALQQEMLAEEQPAPHSPARSIASSKSPAREDGGDETEPSDDDLIVLGEVRASETAAKPAARRWAPRPPPAAQLSEFAQISDRREVSLYIAPPPPVPDGAGTCDCFALVGGLPWWFSDIELRRHAEQFGQIRAIRILDVPRSGKSTGIALLEYVAPDSAQRAAQPREGMSSLPAWESMATAPPRVILVSRELLQMIRAGSLPWPDGGPCQEDLRSILMRQFGQEHIPPPRDRSRGRHRDGFRDNSPRAQRRRPDDTARVDRQQSGCRGIPEPEKPVRDQVGWADKLKRLSGNVNKQPVRPAEPARGTVNKRQEADMENLANLARKVNRRC